MSRLALLLLVLAGQASALEPVLFALHTADGKRPRGTVTTLTEQWQLSFSGQEKPLKSEDWLTLHRIGHRLPPPPEQPHLVLTSGDRVPITLVSLALLGDQLTCSCPWLTGGKATRYNLGAVSMIWRGVPERVDDASQFRRRLLASPRRQDVVVLRNGDTVEGALVRLDGRRLVMQVNRKPISLEMDNLSAVCLSSVLARSTPPREPHARLVLADGGRFTLRAASSDGETLSGTTLEGARLTAPLDQVMALDLLEGRAIYLSHLRHASYEYTPFLGMRWPLNVNRSVAGRSLHLGGHVYDRGLGMHSASRVTYLLPQGTRHFEALVGLDDVTGRRGQVRVQVLVDGKARQLPRDGEVSHVSGPLDLRIDVADGRELTLVVEFGAGGDVGDHVNWVNARIVR